jgi:hypothetical protein
MIYTLRYPALSIQIGSNVHNDGRASPGSLVLGPRPSMRRRRTRPRMTDWGGMKDRDGTRARNRYDWFGRKQTCLVPDAATRARFVLPE